VKLRRIVGNRKETLTIPLHRELDPGSLRAIVRQASGYIPLEDVRPHFYAD
jgi:hypothetical protein